MCEGNLDKVKNHFKNEARGQIEKLMNWPHNSVVLFHSCVDDACFSVKNYHYQKPWEEPKGCTPFDTWVGPWHDDGTPI
jgi:hypothetical protein